MPRRRSSVADPVLKRGMFQMKALLEELPKTQSFERKKKEAERLERKRQREAEREAEAEGMAIAMRRGALGTPPPQGADDAEESMAFVDDAGNTV